MTQAKDQEGTADGGEQPLGGALLPLDPGEQVLASMPSGAFVLDYLPAEAYDNLLVVAVGRGPTAIERTVREAGGNPQRVGVVPVSGTDVDYDGPMWCADRVGPHDLTGISIQFGEGIRHVKPGEGWVVLDNLTVLLMYAESNRVFQLLNSVVSGVRSRDAHGVYPIVREATAEDTYQQFLGLFDRAVDLR